MGEDAKKAFLLQEVAEALRKRWEEAGEQPPPGFHSGGVASFIEEGQFLDIGELAYSALKICGSLVGFPFLSMLSVLPGDARVPPVEYELTKLNERDEWVAVGVRPEIVVDGNKLIVDYGSLPARN